MSKALPVAHLTCPICGRKVSRLTFQSGLSRMPFRRLAEPFICRVVGQCEHCAAGNPSATTGQERLPGARHNERRKATRAGLREALSSLHWYRAEPHARIV